MVNFQDIMIVSICHPVAVVLRLEFRISFFLQFILNWCLRSGQGSLTAERVWLSLSSHKREERMDLWYRHCTHFYHLAHLASGRGHHSFWNCSCWRELLRFCQLSFSIKKAISLCWASVILVRQDKLVLWQKLALQIWPRLKLVLYHIGRLFYFGLSIFDQLWNSL